MEEYKILVEEEVFCEHCGDLEDFEPVFDDDGCTWCLDCASYNDNFNENFNEQDVEKALRESYTKRIGLLNGEAYLLQVKLDKLGAGDNE